MSLFADNIMLYRPVRNATDYPILQSDNDKISIWTESNFCSLMPIGANTWLYNSRIQYSCSPSDSLPALSVNGVALKVDKYKHLGI